MNLVNMKSDTDDSYPPPVGASNYGYGLCLNLNEDQCEKLGITQPLPAGTIVTIQAQAIVESATESVERDGDDTGNDVRMSVQITDLSLKPIGTDKNAAETLYGNNSK